MGGGVQLVECKEVASSHGPAAATALASPSGCTQWPASGKACMLCSHKQLVLMLLLMLLACKLS